MCDWKGFHKREENDDLMTVYFPVSSETGPVSSPYYVDKQSQVWYSLAVESSIHTMLVILWGEG